MAKQEERFELVSEMSETEGGRLSAATKRRYLADGRAAQKRETSKRILDCALKHFSEYGFEASSLRDIAGDAGVTHTVIRQRFGSKEDLWRAAIDEMSARQERELGFDEWLGLESLTASHLCDLIHRYVGYCSRHPENLRIMIHETMRDNERVKWVAEKHIKRTHEPFIRLLQRAIKDGLIADVPVPTLMYILTGSSEMMFALGPEVKHVYGLDVADPAVIAAHADAICKILVQG